MAPDSRFPCPGQIEEAIAVDSLFLGFQTALAGRYSLERELGRGGMGVVYLAREVSLDRPVAIKLLPPTMAADPALRERFLREARTAAQLSQPNIVPIHAVDEAGGFVYFVMAFIEGETLGERVRAHGPLPPAETARILREIAWALAYAHAQGVIHRDLKPDNIILESATGRAVLTDFGIARRLEADGLTLRGDLIGTPEYMSPEQATGEALDPRTDLYSLGIVAFFALSGRLPFEAPTLPALLMQQATAPPPPLANHAPGAPRSLTQAVMRCLEKDPDDRFPDAKGFADALSVALEARREIPAPVRAFVKESLELKPMGCAYAAAVLWLGPSVFMPLLFFLRTGPTGLNMFFFYLLLLFVGVVVIPGVRHFGRVRKLVRAGYGVEDVLAGVRADNDQKKEELVFTVGREAGPVERWLPKVRWPGFVLAMGTILALGTGLVRVVGTPLVPLLALTGLAAWVIGLVADQRRRYVLGERRLKYWGSRFGRWLFKLAGGRSTPRIAGAATHRPTELVLAFAAEDLYAELPKEVKAALPELPETLKKLELQARSVRNRIETLEQALADAGQDPSHGAAASRREALVAELTASRDQARERLSAAVAALETIRLDLLRLRAGAGSLESLTADLAAAGEVGAAVDRLLEAGEELKRELGS